MRKFSFFIILIIFCTFISGLSKTSGTNNSIEDSVQKAINYKQANMMLKLLECLELKKPLDNQIQNIMNEEGTELIIKQMNLVRKISKEQYNSLLVAFCIGQQPQIAPLDSSEKAIRGVMGLKKDVWTVLNWGMRHTGLLKERLNSLESFDVYNESLNLALSNLPEKVEMAPKLFFVMGGRAGAAALSGERVYFDPLVVSFLDSIQHKPFSTKQEIVDYFAHEMHHIGFEKIAEKKRKSLNLSGKDDLFYTALLSILAEGSATYLVSGHRDLEKVFNLPDLIGVQKQTDEMFNEMGRVLLQIQKSEITNEESYEKAIAGLYNIGFHAMGSVILNAIDKTAGFNKVMEVLDNPRKLLLEYNKAADLLRAKGVQAYRFDENVAAEISAMGK